MSDARPINREQCVAPPEAWWATGTSGFTCAAGADLLLAPPEEYPGARPAPLCQRHADDFGAREREPLEVKPEEL